MDVSSRTAYAQAKEPALAQWQVPLLTAGIVQVDGEKGEVQYYGRIKLNDATGEP